MTILIVCVMALLLFGVLSAIVYFSAERWIK